MTREDKDLLLKCLCARLPYGVKCKVVDFPTHGLRGDNDKNVWSIASIIYYPPESEHHEIVHTIHYYPDGGVMHVYPRIDEIKPYLFPMSSMTDEQKNEYYDIVNYISTDDTDNWVEGEFIYIDRCNYFGKLLHFYNRHHLDWRGLIPMGLAIDATGLNIY